MKNFKKLNGILLSAVVGSALGLVSHATSAGEYSSAANIPALHSRGYVHRVDIPMTGTPREGHIIKNVSWNWNVMGWPRGMQVQLCQTHDRCIDVSRQRTGSTSMYNRFLATWPFFFQFKLASNGPSPVAGQLAQVTVTW